MSDKSFSIHLHYVSMYTNCFRKSIKILKGITVYLISNPPHTKEGKHYPLSKLRN